MMILNSLDSGCSSISLIDHSLREALVRKEFVLHYQPFHDLTTQKIAGVEALIRWQHPTNGLIYPDHFIPIAERSDLIGLLGEWVLQESCSQMSKWCALGIDIPSMSVNVSPQQLSSSFLPTIIEETLSKNRLAAEQLDIEITESSRPSDEKAMCGNITSVRRLGVKISIDDFGMGFSSFERLRIMDVDRLKIDRAFIQHISSSSRDASLVRSMIHLARQLGVSVIAEGIEDAETCIRLQSMGCDQGQGYYFARPLDAMCCEKYLLDAQNSPKAGLHETLLQDQFDLPVWPLRRHG